eukprot:8907851-Heterocapsa_arctica.AAC.1
MEDWSRTESTRTCTGGSEGDQRLRAGTATDPSSQAGALAYEGSGHPQQGDHKRGHGGERGS